MAGQMDRVILHCDANNFFASVESLARPELKTVPMAVSNSDDRRHGVILAKNDLAKPFGVKTGESVLEALKKCPGLTLVKPHRAQYGEYSRKLNALYQRYTDRVEAASIDESFLDVTDCQALFGSGEEIANALRKSAREELGLTISVGVSFNKTFAKLGSDYKKPDATTVLSRENFRQILYPLPAGAMLGVGGAAEASLNRIGIHTMGDIAAVPRETLVACLGKFGGAVWDGVMGLDRERVKRVGEYEPPKSIGNGETFPRDIRGREEIEVALMALTDSVAQRLRAHGMVTKTVTVQIKNPSLKVISRQVALAHPTSATLALYRAARDLLLKTWHVEAPIRMLTVTLSGLSDPEDARQLSLFDDEAGEARDERLYHAVDAIRQRYGTDALKPAILLTQLFNEDDPIR